MRNTAPSWKLRSGVFVLMAKQQNGIEQGQSASFRHCGNSAVNTNFLLQWYMEIYLFILFLASTLRPVIQSSFAAHMSKVVYVPTYWYVVESCRPAVPKSDP
jgi:hypothetical protein